MIAIKYSIAGARHTAVTNNVIIFAGYYLQTLCLNGKTVSIYISDIETMLPISEELGYKLI